MPKTLKKNDFFDNQMSYIDQYIRGTLHLNDQRYKNIKKLKKKQTVVLHDDFLKIPPKNLLDNLKIGFTPLEGKDYSKQKACIAPDNKNATQRHLTRYRLIIGPVSFYLNSNLDSSIEIPVITACAPNFFSSYTDMGTFTDGRGTLRTTLYAAECEKIALFIVENAKKEGYKKLIMPAFGLGVYLQKLNDNSKAEARKIMYQAFAKAAEKKNFPVEWILYKGTKKQKENQEKIVNNNYITPVISNDILDYAKTSVTQNENPVILNPGSDRTIGGHYNLKTGMNDKPLPLEEQYTQQSDLLMLHSILNEDLCKQLEEKYEKQKDKSIQEDKSIQDDADEFEFELDFTPQNETISVLSTENEVISEMVLNKAFQCNEKYVSGGVSGGAYLDKNGNLIIPASGYNAKNAIQTALSLLCIKSDISLKDEEHFVKIAQKDADNAIKLLAETNPVLEQTTKVDTTNYTLFRRIYRAIYDADHIFRTQSGPAKQVYDNSVSTTDILSKINKHIERNPDSRSAKAFKILCEYENNTSNTKDFNLFKAIYMQSSLSFFSRRGLDFAEIRTIADLKKKYNEGGHHRTKTILNELEDIFKPKL